MRDLSYRYDRSSVELFGGLSVEFAAGRIAALTGPSGRGKSTLLYLLGLMLTPRAGQVLLAGGVASDLSDAQRSFLRAQRIGFVFQDAALDPYRTVGDAITEPARYLGTPLSAARGRAMRLLARFGLAGYEGRRPAQLSGGQAQRVALCRALLNRPVIILADEPTGNLDRDNATGVLGALRQAADHTGAAIVIATHDPFVIALADEVVEL